MFFYPKKLDLDRLHRTIERLPEPHYNRRTGKTTAYLYLMLGAAQVSSGNGEYVYIGPTHCSVDMVMKDFTDILFQEQIKFKYNRAAGLVEIIHPIPNNKTTFRFYSADNAFRWPGRFKGTKITQTFLDVNPDILEHLEYEESVYEMHLRSERVI